ncbi:MAG: DNA starvation/stationary phase protection protein Dps [Halieaceae bacterium]|jgi:starvation-inducible DNA-binding protein|nr:DNA starvation/stationary phase protection protein Dps [Halieaceae bacterium]
MSQQKSNIANFTVPGMQKEPAKATIAVLEERLTALIDLQLTLKHIHWNVVGPNFIGVHEMLDPQVDSVREMTDTIAERIATLGGVPVGTPGAVSSRRGWDDYSLGRATVIEHLGALDLVYSGVNESHREAIGRLAEIDPVSEDMLIGQAADLEQFQWFVRAHLESSSGELPTLGEKSEHSAAKKAASQ